MILFHTSLHALQPSSYFLRKSLISGGIFGSPLLGITLDCFIPGAPLKGIALCLFIGKFVFFILFRLWSFLILNVNCICLKNYYEVFDVFSSLFFSLGTLSVGAFMLTATWGLIVNCICLLVMGATNCGPDSMLAGSVAIDVSFFQFLN